MRTRREMLAGSAAAVLGLSGCGTTRSAADAGGAADALLSAQFDTFLQRYPEVATNLQLDTGARARLREGLTVLSPATLEARRAEARSELAAVRRVARGRLPPDQQVHVDKALFTLENETALGRFAYHVMGGGRPPGPYGPTQFGGAYISTPRFLETSHPIKTAADCEAYLSRLEAFAEALDGDTACALNSAARGAVAPGFILEKAATQVAALRDGAAADQPAVRSLARRAAAEGIAGDWGGRARRVWDERVRAALARQVEALEALKARAGDRPAMSRLPDGEAYYAELLRHHTTTDLGAEEIHRMGLEQVAELESRIETLLRAQGFTSGSMADRMRAIADRPGSRFPNTDAGRAELIAYCTDRLAALNSRIPTVFSRMPKMPMEVRRYAPEIEGGAAGASAQPGAPDGSRPGIFWINLKDTAEWPRHTLPTLTAHEASPGHLFEGGLALERADTPEYAKIGIYPAYSEGWALYVERVADEIGLYDDDPFGRLGYLSSYLFRARRLVVDTGLHAKGWGREQAAQQLSSGAGGSALREVDRYCVMPAQACSYKVGQTVIQRLRDEVQTRASFDMKRFHDAVLRDGRVPLTILERRVRQALT